jgi:hypothetical protein
MMEEKLQEVKSTDNVTVLKYGNTMIKVKNVEVENEVDPDRITKIDLNNLIAEIITTPVLVNRWGNIMAELDACAKKEKMKFEILCANEKEKIRIKLLDKGGKKPTISEVEDTLIQKPVYKIAKTKLIEAEKDSQIVNSIYWAVKDKSDKLNKLSLTIQREDLDSIQNTVINGVKILTKNIT